MAEAYKFRPKGGPLFIIKEGHYFHEACAGLSKKQFLDAATISHKPTLEERCGKCQKSLKKWLFKGKPE